MAPFGGRGQSSGSYGGRGGGRGRGGGGGRGGRGGFRGGRDNGPKLPAELLEQVDAKYGSGGGRRDISRKEKRKAERDDKRGPAQRARRPSPAVEDEEEEERPPAKKAKTALPPTSLKGKGKAEEKNEKKEKKKKLPELTLPEMDTTNDVEDKEIEWLEYMLKKEKKPKDEDDLEDGLDDLLDFTAGLGRKGSGAKGSMLDESDSDSEEDEDEDEMIDLDEDEENEEDEEEQSDERAKDEEEFQGFSDNDDAESESGSQGEDDPSEQGPVDSQTLADAAPASEDQLAPTKYVPPHLRAAQLAEKAKGDKAKMEARMKLERKAQGLLNRLSEQNLESILGEIEGLYRDNSRNDTTSTLTDLVIQMISNKANLLDSFVVLYATLVGALHRIIGIEFGAHFTQTLVMKYIIASTSTSPDGDTESKESTIQATIYETPDAGKESINLLTLIAELYNAQVVGSRLIYDLVRGFIESEGKEGQVMGEREIEGLLKVLRCSGSQLRSDDPASLKDIVNLVQAKTKGKEKTMTARARFMVETLTNVNKHGKLRAGAEGEAGTEAAQRMKKFLSGLGKKRRLLAYEPLRVSLSDLTSADKKGKWWLVGAGWSGNPLVDLEQQREQEYKGDKKGKKSVKGQEVEKDSEAALVELARKQGMNTDVRRGVFVVLMTSEDYAHACDRLSHFKLSDVQQREFVRVALHCCGLEPTYNPYYTLILNHLCANSYDHRFTFQYALWDFMRELENGSSVTKQKLGNVARAVAYVVARGGLDLTVFKAIDFTSLSKPLTRFLTTFLPFFLIALQSISPIFNLPKAWKQASDFDDEIVQERFEKVLSNSELAGGWLWVLDREMKSGGKWEGEVQGDREREVVRKGVEVAKAVLGAAV
ncbi:hypothetical protein IAR50_006649 [Cryptococcus sp. DSM 104548]